MNDYTFKLTPVPRSTGGVKYESSIPGESRPWTTYIPQSVLTKEFGEFPQDLVLNVKLVQ